MEDHTPTSPVDTVPARELSALAAGLSYEDLPAAVLERARLHILDGLGLGIASVSHPFAQATLAAVGDLSPDGGTNSIIGTAHKASPRDSALVNGVLIHGLDFDDTHQQAIVHPTAASLPAALAVAEARDLDGRALLAAYCAGMETAIRIGVAVKGGFHHTGFHATGIVSHFSSAIAAGRLMGLDANQITAAQGIAASTASGVQVFLEEGAWTKRLHPGWGAVAGITAATLAGRGFRGPSRPFEGTFGLFETHLQQQAHTVDLEILSRDLGVLWMMEDTALKPYPVCHFIHGCADAAIAARAEIDGTEIAAVEILLPADTLPIVAEPAEAKRNATTEYEAKFSAPFVVATCLLRGAFGLEHLTEGALGAADVQALARCTTCSIDPESAFPTYFSGGVRVHLADGREVFRHVRVNSGAGERKMDEAAVSAKFLDNATPVLGQTRAEALRDAVLQIEQTGARRLGRLLQG